MQNLNNMLWIFSGKCVLSQRMATQLAQLIYFLITSNQIIVDFRLTTINTVTAENQFNALAWSCAGATGACAEDSEQKTQNLPTFSGRQFPFKFHRVAAQHLLPQLHRVAAQHSSPSVPLLHRGAAQHPSPPDPTCRRQTLQLKQQYYMCLGY